jgi:hypothetical protein
MGVLPFVRTDGSAARRDKPRREDLPMKVQPFRSKLPGTDKHHNDNKCTEGNNIEAQNRISGTGGLPLCSHCKRL